MATNYGKSRNPVKRISTVANILMDEAEMRKKNPSKVYGIASWGKRFARLDEITGGLHDKQMVILAARMKHGKSMLAASLVPNLAAQCPEDKIVRVVSLEMSQEAYVRRMASILARVPDPSRILQGYWDGQEDAYDRYVLALEEVADLPIEFWNEAIDTQTLERFVSGQDMTGHGREQPETFMWVLDHAGLVSNVQGSGASYQSYVGTANAIMEICHTYASGLIITHLNRGAGPGGMGTQDNLAGTDAYGKNYDTLFLLARPFMGAPPSVIEAIGGEEVLENGEPAVLNVSSRNGAGGTDWLWWSGKYAQFQEMAQEDVEFAQQAVNSISKGKK